jgi:hypothetical protein
MSLDSRWSLSSTRFGLRMKMNKKKGKNMDKKRLVHQMLAVFKLSDCVHLDMKRDVESSVMFRYDEKQNTKEFRLLNDDIPDNLRDKIISWLDRNIDVDNSMFH